jgi:hypothetical protein
MRYNYFYVTGRKAFFDIVVSLTCTIHSSLFFSTYYFIFPHGLTASDAPWDQLAFKK